MLDTSTFFDESFYLAKNLDVFQAIASGQFQSGLDHFSRFGDVERRDPSALFDTSYYLQQNLDVASAVGQGQITGFDHFIQFGQQENRDPTPLFNPTYYLLKNPDVESAVERDELTGLEHFVRFGQYEGRDPSAVFDTLFYLNSNQDVKTAVERQRDQITGIEHFVAYGKFEGRNPSTFFDTSYYLGQNSDVTNALNQGLIRSAIDHFLSYGRQEGRFSIPSFNISNPTGPYAVGTVTLPLIDTSRDEIFTPDPNDKRELVIQIWYPAATNPAEITIPAPYLDAATRQVSAQNLEVPPNLFDLIRPTAVANAAVSPAQTNYPVLIFSHGLLQQRAQNTNEVEDLASHGYVVVGINHTYIAGVTQFPDGRVIPANTSLLPSDPSQIPTALSQAVGVTAGDASFVLSALSGLNTNDPSGRFTGHLDLANAGIFGHSFGGITATAALQFDPRFKAGINMDGPILGSALTTNSINRPYMLMNAQQPYRQSLTGSLFQQFDQRQTVYQNATDDSYNLTILGTEHENFSDRSVLLPIGSIYSPNRFTSPGARDIGVSYLGPINNQRAAQIINNYTLAFFDRYLKGETEPLLAGPSPDFPDVQFASRNT